MASRLLIFDGDGTLWKTQHFFEHAKQKLAQLLLNEGLAENANQIVQSLDSLDKHNVSQWGFTQNRFFISTVQTYFAYASKSIDSVSNTVISQLREIASQPFDSQPEPMPELQKVLANLYRENTLILYTGRSQHYIEPLLSRFGILRFFHSVYIADQDVFPKSPTEEGRFVLLYRKKGLGALKLLLAHQNASFKNVWVVGNSPRSDILPALQLGTKGIWMKSEHWQYDEIAFPTRCVHTVQTLPEIDSILNMQSTFFRTVKQNLCGLYFKLWMSRHDKQISNSL